MSSIENLKNFDIKSASISFWVFKGPNGPAADIPKYSGQWVETNDEVAEFLKSILQSEVDRISELIDYSLLAENNEKSALRIPQDNTFANNIIRLAIAQLPEKRIKDPKAIYTSDFHIIKAVTDHKVLYGVRKSSLARVAKSTSNATFFYEANKLILEKRPRFTIDSSLDFILFDQDVFVYNKLKFESILRYKADHQRQFAALQAEPAFVNLFVDVQPLVHHVGANKMHLRRVVAIHAKGHFRDPKFMSRLWRLHAQYQLNIQFDKHGKIIASADTCGHIITALLDHRLRSGFSETVYDVPSSTAISTKA